MSLRETTRRIDYFRSRDSLQSVGASQGNPQTPQFSFKPDSEIRVLWPATMLMAESYLLVRSANRKEEGQTLLPGPGVPTG